MAFTRCAAIARSPEFPLELATSPCSIRRRASIRRNRCDRNDHGPPRHLSGYRATTSCRPRHSLSSVCVAMPGRRGKWCFPISTWRSAVAQHCCEAGRGGRSRICCRRSSRLGARPNDDSRQPRRAALPANVRAILTRPRKSGEAEAAVDRCPSRGSRGLLRTRPSNTRRFRTDARIRSSINATR